MCTTGTHTTNQLGDELNKTYENAQKWFGGQNMCGIVGYIGNQDAKEYLLKGLEKLEYRGYDSAGIAIADQTQVYVFKEKGRIANLRSEVAFDVQASTGIGHTRWATHGVPSKINSHPHQCETGRFTLVHNGVIDNYEYLRDQFLSDVSLKSDTDTEVIVQIIGKLVQTGSSPEEAFIKILELVEGSYAIAMIDRENLDKIYVAKNKSPLLVGVGKDFNVVTSDAMAMLQLTDQFIELMDKEVVIVTKESIMIRDLQGNVMSRDPFTALIDAEDIEKGTYPHYMLKEIEEQPTVIRKIIQKYLNESGKLAIDQAVIDEILCSDRIYVIACGTSFHSGLVGKQLIESIAQIPVEVHVASEFTYNPPILSDRPFFIFITQSGETADIRAALVEIKGKGYASLAITNVPGSTISRESNYTLLLHAGPEIAVASTKAYTAQLAVLTILAAVLAEKKDLPSQFDVIHELGIIANVIDSICVDKVEFEKIAAEYLSVSRNCFFIGRGIDYHVSLEGALKLKEISYIQAEGFAGGELKHGTIALIENLTPVIAITSQAHVNLAIRGNVKEVAARGANSCIISMQGLDMKGDRYIVPKVHPAMAAIVMVIPLQYVSYYAALARGCDIDKPRNLAKSVTVE